MNHLFLTLMVIAAIVCLSSCQKENIEFSNSNYPELESTAKSKDHKDKVYVCHKGKTIHISSNAVGAHQSGHGDAVDMDGDGYFDKDCDCGPLDCDDTDASLTDNCCPTECGFCEYVDLFDFDEPCENGGRRWGDWYCSSSYERDYLDSNGCMVNQTYGYSRLYDRDYNRRYRCNNNNDSEFDRGYILAYWSKSTACRVVTYRSYTRYYLYDYLTHSYKVSPVYLPTSTEEGYNLAQACGRAMDELAASLNIQNSCAPADAGATTSDAKALNGQKLSLEELLQRHSPELEDVSPEVFIEMNTDIKQ